MIEKLTARRWAPSSRSMFREESEDPLPFGSPKPCLGRKTKGSLGWVQKTPDDVALNPLQPYRSIHYEIRCRPASPARLIDVSTTDSAPP
jgi:hypothetical protein